MVRIGKDGMAYRMLASLRRARRPPWTLLLSGGLHAVTLALLLYAGRRWVAPMHLPGSHAGARVVLTYLPGRAPLRADAPATASPKLPTRPVRPLATPRRPLEAPQPVPSPAPSTAAQPTPSTGADAFGDGDVSIALLHYFPPPRPDLSHMPHGMAGDVILDAVIDETGKIVQLTKTKGIGYGIDEAVIATVQQWTFLPATRDGKPVASEQELHFHYEKS